MHLIDEIKEHIFACDVGLLTPFDSRTATFHALASCGLILPFNLHRFVNE